MPVRVERLPNEPILIATLSGLVTEQDFFELYHLSSALIGMDGGAFYRISDLRAATSTFGDILKAIQKAAQEMPASLMDPQIQVTFVGENTWINLARDFFLKRGINLPVFLDMENALESVRIRIASEQRNAGVVAEQ
ncbi:MAG: hypothetical protein ABI700_15260 [Chloroflexota bacterium]